MGSVGDCYDNAMGESFFASLETELFDQTTFRTRADARREAYPDVIAARPSGGPPRECPGVPMGF